MYYLRKAPYKKVIPEIKKTNGEVIPEREYITDDRALYKSNRFSRYYRQSFTGLDSNPPGMHLYTCKTLRTIERRRRELYDYCGEIFDVYDENGIVDVPWQISLFDNKNESEVTIDG